MTHNEARAVLTACEIARWGPLSRADRAAVRRSEAKARKVAGADGAAR
jgi:hypothetical protein